MTWKAGQMVVSSIEITWWELTGLLGACLYAASYVCAAFDKIPSQSIHYYLIKLIAATLVLVSLTNSFNLASVVIQVFFITVSIIGVLRHVGNARRGVTPYGIVGPSGPVMPAEFRTDRASVVVQLSQSETADKNCRSLSDFG